MSSPVVSFARGVIARLAVWPALRIAVENNWGGSESAEKRTWVASVIVDAFEEQEPKPDLEYVEETLTQIMADEFETVLEDDSAIQVARDVIELWSETQTGSTDLMKRFEEQADSLQGKRVVAQQGIDEEDWESDSEDEEEDEDGVPALVERAPQLPQIDEDGFTKVKGKGKSNH